MANIAAGVVDAAAGMIEKSLASTIPVILTFLERLLHLPDIGGAVKKIIGKVQGLVDKAIDKVVEFIKKGAAFLIGKGKQVAGAVTSWFQKEDKFKVGAENHKLSFAGGEGSAKLMLSSDPTPVTVFLDTAKSKVQGNPEGQKNYDIAHASVSNIDAIVAALKKLKPDKDKDLIDTKNKELQTEMDKIRDAVIVLFPLVEKTQLSHLLLYFLHSQMAFGDLHLKHGLFQKNRLELARNQKQIAALH